MIPVLHTESDCLARAWENSLLNLYKNGVRIDTEYGNDSIDATMIITVNTPLKEPMLHLDLPCDLDYVEEYIGEMCEGTKDHLIKPDPKDKNDHRWEYTYHDRLFNYTNNYDQIEAMCIKLADAPHSRRAQAITWKPWIDPLCYDPPCLQSIWCRITTDPVSNIPHLNMNVRFRSNDAYKASLLNMIALISLQIRIAKRIMELSGQAIQIGRYCHMADSYHIYGKNLSEFRDRFLKAVYERTFDKRTLKNAVRIS